MNKVVNIKYNQKYDIYCGRPGKGMKGPFGNPFIVGKDGETGECVAKFKSWLYSDHPKAVLMRQNILETIQCHHTLGCFCVDKDGNGECHAKVIAEFVYQNKGNKNGVS